MVYFSLPLFCLQCTWQSLMSPALWITMARYASAETRLNAQVASHRQLQPVVAP
jgi:hypothetical protein